jgi:photosystem II stability/assembly factor-like uncharacterized protein
MRPCTTSSRQAAWLVLCLCLSAVSPMRAQQTGGRMFATIYDAPPPHENPLLLHASTGVALSTDGGVTWRSTAWVTNRSNALCQDPDDGATLYLASDYGVLRSTDEGLQWAQTTPWNLTDALCIAAGMHAIWIGTARGVFVSTDHGARWTARSSGLPALNGQYVSDLILANDTLLIATADGLFASGDRGLSWSRKGLQGLPIDKIVRHQQMLYALSSVRGLRTSLDGGATWSEHPSELTSKNLQCAIVHPIRPQEIFVGTRDLGVLQSTDGGAHWMNRSGGLTNLNVAALAFDPADPSIIYLGTENGSYISRNGGASWEQYTIRMGAISSFFLPVRP